MSRSPFGPRSPWTEQQGASAPIPQVQGPQGAPVQLPHSSPPNFRSQRSGGQSAAGAAMTGLASGVERGMGRAHKSAEYQKLRAHEKEMQEDQQSHEMFKMGEEAKLRDKAAEAQLEREKKKLGYEKDMELEFQRAMKADAQEEQRRQRILAMAEERRQKLETAGGGLVPDSVLNGFTRAKTELEAAYMQGNSALDLRRRIQYAIQNPDRAEAVAEGLKEGRVGMFKQVLDAVHHQHPRVAGMAGMPWEALPGEVDKLVQEGVDPFTPEGWKEALARTAEKANISRPVLEKELDGFIGDFTRLTDQPLNLGNLNDPTQMMHQQLDQGDSNRPGPTVAQAQKLQKGTSIGLGRTRGVFVSLNSVRAQKALEQVRDKAGPEQVERLQRLTDPWRTAIKNYAREFGLGDITATNMLADIQSGRAKIIDGLLDAGDFQGLDAYLMDEADRYFSEAKRYEKYLENFDEAKFKTLPEEYFKEVSPVLKELRNAVASMDQETALAKQEEADQIFQRYQQTGQALAPATEFEFNPWLGQEEPEEP